MSEQSNEELAMRIAAGEKDLIPILWEQIMPFVLYKAEMFYYSQGEEKSYLYELDDLVQESYFALLSAVNHFDCKKDYQFTTLFGLTLKSAFENIVGYKSKRRRNDPIKYAYSLDGFINGNDRAENDTTLMEILPDPNNEIEAFEDSLYTQQLHVALENALKTISKKHADILKEIYYNNKTQAEIAEKYNCTRKNIDNTKTRALHQLKKNYATNGLKAFLDEHTNYFTTVSLTEFKNTFTSSTEKIVLARERFEKKYRQKEENENRKITLIKSDVEERIKRKESLRNEKTSRFFKKYKANITKGDIANESIKQSSTV